jgi:hypothetical protein
LWLKVVLLILKQPKQVQFVDNNNGDPQGAQAYLAQHGSTIGWGLKEGGSVRKQNGHCKTGDFLTMSVLVDICDPMQSSIPSIKFRCRVLDIDIDTTQTPFNFLPENLPNY